MTFRSRLFATVALPVLSSALIATPTLADALMKPFEVAQESTDQGQGQPSEEELLQQQQDAQPTAEEEQQGQAEEQKAAEEAERAAAEQKAAEEEAQRAAAEEQKAAEEAEKAASDQKAAEEEAQRAAAEEQKAAEEAEKAASDQKAAEDEAQRAAAEEQQRQADEQKAAGEAEKAASDQKAAEDEAQRAAAEEQQRQAEEQKAVEEQKPAEDQQAEQPVEQPDGSAAETTTGEEQPATTTGESEQQPTTGEGEQPAVAGEEKPAETGTEQPTTAETGETPATEPVPEVVDTQTEEQKQEIAKDPGQTDETVVLPVENGAAVLDSDKDADNSGGQKSRDQRRKQREELRAQEEEVPVPDSDDSAQTAISEEVREAVSGKIEAGNREEGRRVKRAPDFEVPETTNIINNTVINNTTIDNSVTQVNVIERVENRTVLEVGDQLIVRGDDRPRLRRDSEEVYYDNLARGRVRETIVRPGGVQIVTIYNRYGDIIQRSRVGRDGQEYILVYAPELEGDSPRPGLVDVGYELPPMRLRIPVSDYIIDTSSNPDRDYYEFLAEPPVERVERVYTIDEVKQSARLRDKVRRIDLDTITFATGSAEVPMSQARTLRSVADAMQKVLDKDPGETFLIEGHTDAVGSDKANLVLSDERGESVASLLTDVYGIPPENLQTQGYGERFLKVKTQVAEQQNRRVTIRRVTTLVRPMARAN